MLLFAPGMQEHKHAGKSATTASHGHARDDDHAPGPGKQSRVEAAGPIAHAAGGNEGGFDTSATTSKSWSHNLGAHPQVHVETTVDVKLTKGKGAVSINVEKGSVQVGSDPLGMSLKSAQAAKGTSLGVKEGEATVVKGDTSNLKASWRDVWFGPTWTTEWKVSHKDWSATITVSSFAGVKPEPPKGKQHHRSKIEQIGHGIVAAAEAVHDATKAIIDSSPEWGPIVLAGAAAIAGGATSVASG